MWIWYIVAGIFGGVIAGMGMGGGTLLIPILTLLLDVEQKISQSINLVVFIPTAIVALIIHYKNKLVETKIGLLIVATGVVSSVLSAWLATTMSNEQLRIYFGIFLIFIGLFQLFDSISQYKSDNYLAKDVYIRSKYHRFQFDKK